MSFAGDIGSAVDDIFSGIGSLSAASAYSKAQQIAQQNAQLTATSTKIQETQTARQAYQVIGGQQAEIAGAGFAEAGSAGDLFRSSSQQAGLAKALTNIQGTVTEQGFESQAAAYGGQAAAAKAQAAGGFFGSLLKLVGAAVTLF